MVHRSSIIYRGWLITVGYVTFAVICVTTAVFRYIAPCPLLDVYERLGGICSLHHQRLNFNIEKIFFLIFGFNPEDAGRIFILDVCMQSEDHTEQQLKRRLPKWFICSLSLLFYNIAPCEW
jgi:hypothetical protein